MSSAFRTLAIAAVVATATAWGPLSLGAGAAHAADPAKAEVKEPAATKDDSKAKPAAATPAKDGAGKDGAAKDGAAKDGDKKDDAKDPAAKDAVAKDAKPAPVPPPPKALPPELSGECAWVGKRVVSLLMRDDVEQSRRFMEFYRLFACKERHIAPTFRCVIDEANAPAAEELTARVDRCWDAAAN